jgi:hypothetical protein
MGKIRIVLGMLLLGGCSGGVEGERFDESGREPTPARGEGNVIGPAAKAPSGADSESEKALCLSMRTDHQGSVVLTNGNWGTWAECSAFCPEGSFAYEASIKAVANQGTNGDDVAVSAFDISCLDRTTGEFKGFAMANQYSAGGWFDPGVCAWPNKPIVGGSVRLEEPQGGGEDDTSANGQKLLCRGDSFNNAIVLPTATFWGYWQSHVWCPTGQAVCGINTRIEGTGPVGSRDDTAVNGLKYECCTF